MSRHLWFVVIAVWLLGSTAFVLADQVLPGAPISPAVVLLGGVGLVVWGWVTRRIGWLFLGCLVAGLGAGIVMVAGPLAGAGEDVLSGAFLLAFGLGWALLTVLSARTGQIHWWPAAPAICFSLVGGALLVVRPDEAALDRWGWVWPPLVVVVGVWLVVRGGSRLTDRTRRWLLYPVVGVLVLVAIGGSYQTVGQHLDRGAFPAPGELVDVDGHKMHLRCVGTGRPTVVLEALSGGVSPVWAWIQPAVARETRACVYDRAGRGWSETTAGDLDGIGVADDLHTLLERAGEEGPFVLVGHSIGGLYVRIFADRHPQDVAGLVLLDASHPEQYIRVPEFATERDDYRRLQALFPPLARVGLFRLYFDTGGDLDFGGLPPPARAQMRAIWSTPRLHRSQRDENAAIPTIYRQARGLGDLGDLPLMVVSAAPQSPKWPTLQDELTTLSSNSVHHVLPHATHVSLVFHERDANQVTAFILDVVNAARTSTPPPGS